MSTKLKAGTATSGAVIDADTSGILELQSGSTPTTAITVDASQNVGIGTISPTANRKVDAVLDVNSSGGIKVTNSNTGTSTACNTYYSNGLTIGEFGILGRNYAGYGALVANASYIYSANSPVTIGADSNYISFGTGAGVSERMRIDSSGNLLVGKTGQTSTEKFGVTFAAGNSGIYTQVASTGTQFHLVFNNGSVVGAISTNGSLTTYSVSSDYRLKENITPLSNGLDKILKIQPKSYNYKKNPESQIEGFIAHELQDIVPHAVVGEKDAVDAEGNPIYQGVDASFLIPYLVSAIQELNAKVTALEAQLGAK